MSRSERVRTEFVLKKAIRMLAIGGSDMVLYLGTNHAPFYDLVHRIAGECHGVERDPRTTRKLSVQYRGIPNVLIQHGLPTNLPYPKSFFHKVVFHEVSTLVSSELELRRVLDEISRVAAPEATIFVGGVAYAEERPRTIIDRITATVDRWLGFDPTVRIPLFPHVVERWFTPRRPGVLITDHAFLSMSREYGLAGEPTNIERTHALSASRSDFLLKSVGRRDKGTRVEVSHDKHVEDRG